MLLGAFGSLDLLENVVKMLFCGILCYNGAVLFLSCVSFCDNLLYVLVVILLTLVCKHVRILYLRSGSVMLFVRFCIGRCFV